MKNKILLVIFVTLILIFTIHVPQPIKSSTKKITIDNPIDINGNTDFINQATTNGWPGNGTKFNPYIIQNLFIISSTIEAIKIVNTNLYFIIRNCDLEIRNSISFDNVSNSIIDSNTIMDRISFTDSNNNVIISNHGGEIVLHNSSSNFVLNNTLKPFFYPNGIQIVISTGNKIENNSIFGFNYQIILDHSPDNQIENNFITGNLSITNYGISLFQANNCTFLNNSITNTSYSLYFTGNPMSYFLYNNFINNFLDIYESITSTQSLFMYNYWSKENNTDTNNDGIADTPYVLYGSIVDNKPRSLQNSVIYTKTINGTYLIIQYNTEIQYNTTTIVTTSFDTIFTGTSETYVTNTLSFVQDSAQFFATMVAILMTIVIFSIGVFILRQHKDFESKEYDELIVKYNKNVEEMKINEQEYEKEIDRLRDEIYKSKNGLDVADELELEQRLLTLKPNLPLEIPCKICKKMFEEDSKILACPHCLSPFHGPHIEEWLKIKGTCPNCNKKI